MKSNNISFQIEIKLYSCCMEKLGTKKEHFQWVIIYRPYFLVLLFWGNSSLNEHLFLLEIALIILESWNQLYLNHVYSFSGQIDRTFSFIFLFRWRWRIIFLLQGKSRTKKSIFNENIFFAFLFLGEFLQVVISIRNYFIHTRIMESIILESSLSQHNISFQDRLTVFLC